MYEQVEKPKENKSRTVANSVTQKSSESIFQFVDNRPEAIAQRRIQSIITDQQPFSVPIQLMKKWTQEDGFQDIQGVPVDKEKWLRCKYKGEEIYVSCADMENFSQEDWDCIEYYDDEVLSDRSDVESDTDDQVEEDDFELLTVKQIFPEESPYHGLPGLEGPVNAWENESFAGMGAQDELESIVLQRPKHPGTHYEILAVVGGVSVKIDLTSSGYRLIYNADPQRSADYFQEPVPVLVEGKMGKDLYAAFIAIARNNGKYDAGTNDCQRFAQDVFNDITDAVNEFEW